MSPFGGSPGPCSPRHADPLPPRREEIVQLDGATKKALETGRSRLLIGGALFALAFIAICGRLVDVTLFEDGIDPRTAEQPSLAAPVAERADISVAELKAKLSTAKSFVWLQRNLTPRQEYDVPRLGIMGLYFPAGERRVYPMGSLTSHVVGFTDIDNKGLGGIEQSFDDVLAGGRHPVQLSLDV